MSRNLPRYAMIYIALITFVMAQYGRQRDLQSFVRVDVFAAYRMKAG